MKKPFLKYLTRVTQLTILPIGEPIFSESATQITIQDDAAGEFVKIKQQFDIAAAERETITVNPDEWPHLKAAVETLLAEIAKHETP